MRIWSDNLQLPYKFDSHQFIMVEMVIIFKMVIMVQMVKMVEMVRMVLFLFIYYASSCDITQV